MSNQPFGQPSNNDVDTAEKDKQSSDAVIRYSNQVEDVIAWMFCREEELQKRNGVDLQEASLDQMLLEYSHHEKFITEISEYCHTIMRCKEEGQALNENDEISGEERDEIGIRMDAMLVLYDKLKILSADRLHNLQRAIDERQKSKINRLEKWIASMKSRLSSSGDIGTDYEALRDQLIQIEELQKELEQKQEFLNLVSRLIEFDDVDIGENLEERLADMNGHWTEICQTVNERHKKLRKAIEIWELLHAEGSHLYSWLEKIQTRLNELVDATQTNIEKSFQTKLLEQTEKIDSEIKNKHSLFIDLEDRVKNKISKFNDPCSAFVIELEKKFEDIQEVWRKIFDQKRMIDRRLQEASDPSFILNNSERTMTPPPSDQNWSELDSSAQVELSEIEDEEEIKISESYFPSQINENGFDTNGKGSAEDLEISDEFIKRCLLDRKEELADKERWRRLSKTLQNNCHYLISQMDKVIPENDLGVDLITLAQQQDQLVHLTEELDSNTTLQSSIEDSNLFLKLYDILLPIYQPQHQPPHITVAKNLAPRRFLDIWTTVKEFKDEIENNLDRLTLHYSEISQMIEDRQSRLYEIHKRMHTLQHCIQDLAAKLQVAEILKSNWVSLDNLSIEELSEQLEELKLYRERLIEVETVHNEMVSTLDWMNQFEVRLSHSNSKRVEDLESIWDSIQSSVEERQKSIEHAFDEQSGSEQKFLTGTVQDLPGWERRVATSKVPYFIDHETEKTFWDHPKFTKLLDSMDDFKMYVFSAYRTAMKLRLLQKGLGIDKLMLEQLKEFLKQHNLIKVTTVEIEKIILLLKTIYEHIQGTELSLLNVPVSIDLTLNWLLNLFDPTRTGHVSALSLKVGLAIICCATQEEKYVYMFESVSDQNSGTIDSKKLGTLFELCTRIPTYLGENESFGNLVESSIRNCLEMSKFKPKHPNCIDINDFLNWLKSEPQIVIWLPVLHRLLISENTIHHQKCKLCGANPIVGLRYRCLKCLKFNICQRCFLTGRHVFEHHDPAKHPLREYRYPSSFGDQVRDITKIVRSAFI